jgi:succinate-semialdehyde dehydrogenase/glutarate-semialdehyde dehydrogenase
VTAAQSVITTVNPATGETVEQYAAHDDGEVERRLEAAARAFGLWRDLSVAQRASVLRAAAERLDACRDDYARLMTREMGKPIGAARAEVEKCAWVCRHYAEHGERYLAPQVVATEASKSYVRFDPLGPVLAIMPWNFPFWQVFRFAAPALMAGNVGLLKHASNVAGSALAIEDVFRRAGLPEGGFQALLVPPLAVAAVTADRRIRAVTLTGSDAAGSAVAAQAGTHVKKTVLELGGSDPFVVLADADLDQAARVGAAARMQNSGQSCIAAKRFIVHRDVARPFTERFVERVAAMRVGDPMDPATEIGPLARADLRDSLHDQVRRTVEQGARLVLGGKPLDRAGFFYAPTVLDGVRPEHAAAVEETFGPVAAILSAASDEEAIALANASPYGLGASLWTTDLAKGERLAAGIEAGSVFINAMVKSDSRLPFGGVKRSGYGRELGEFGIREFVNVKTVWVG